MHSTVLLVRIGAEICHGTKFGSECKLIRHHSNGIIAYSCIRMYNNEVSESLEEALTIPCVPLVFVRIDLTTNH